MDLNEILHNRTELFNKIFYEYQDKEKTCQSMTLTRILTSDWDRIGEEYLKKVLRELSKEDLQLLAETAIMRYSKTEKDLIYLLENSVMPTYNFYPTERDSDND